MYFYECLSQHIYEKMMEGLTMDDKCCKIQHITGIKTSGEFLIKSALRNKYNKIKFPSLKNK